jgi:hypothetical protein
MAIDDLRLDRPSVPSIPDPPSPAPASPLRWVAVALAGVVAGAALMFFWMSNAQPTPAAPPSPAALEDVSASNRPKRQPIDLPALSDSDALMRTLVGALADHPWLARLLATRGLVRGAVLATVQIGDGRTPIDLLKAIRPSTRATLPTAQPGRLDPANYDRWGGAIGALTSVSPRDAAQVYVNVKPLIDEAYIELGSGGGSDFDHAIVRAIQVLASTPALTEEPILGRRPGYLEHEDPDLKALKPVQKQFLLMGPDHRRRALDWLRQFATALDLRV